MKKKSSRAQVPYPKPDAGRAVADYFQAVPLPARNVLEKLRLIIRSVVPKDATEVISYRIPAFRQKKVIVWYAAFSDHCSLFPAAAVIEKFKDELEGYRISKGTIQFPLDKPLPSGLIKRIVKTRLAELKE